MIRQMTYNGLIHLFPSESYREEYNLKVEPEAAKALGQN